MRQATVLLILTLAISLGAIVNLGDEYIGPTPMGQFRKTYDRRENSTPYFYSNTSYHYYYDEEIPDRLTLIQSCHDNIDFTTFSKLIYEYHDFADYRQVIENEYFKGWENYWEEDGYVLQYTTTYTYNLQDKLLERETVSFEEDGTESGTQRFVYGYDEKGNVVLMEIYQSWTDAEPYEATTYDYDAPKPANSLADGKGWKHGV